MKVPAQKPPIRKYFEVLTYMHTLHKAGIPQEAAEIQAKTVSDLIQRIDERSALTKADLDETNLKIEQVRYETEQLRKDLKLELQTMNHDFSLKFEQVRHETEQLRKDLMLETQSLNKDLILETQTLRKDLTLEIQILRNDLTLEIQAINSDLAQKIEAVRSDLTLEIQAIRSDLTRDIQAIRSDLTRDIQAVRTDLTLEIEKVHTKIETVRSDLLKNMNRMLLWMFGMLTFFTTSLLAVMAKGFHWI